MEPRSFDRGDAQCGDVVHRGDRASMEPRSFDRGDDCDECSNLDIHKLQWSRGLLTAETGRRSAGRQGGPGKLQWSRGLLTAETVRFERGFRERSAVLQWSRGLLTAETRSVSQLMRRKIEASMEPRSFDRGDARNEDRLLPSTCGFNGAAVF